MKRFFCLCCLLAALCLPLAGCAQKAQPAEAEASGPAEPAAEASRSAADYKFLLPYSAADGLNPYLSNNVLTLQAADLLFEKMVEIDPNWKLQYAAVSGCTVSGTSAVLTVNTGCTFADGSTLSAADVAACLEAARTSKAYGARFANVAAVAVTDAATVTVTLTQPDSMFAWLLDIPVLHAADVASPRPAASGRYTYGDGADTLVPSPAAAAGSTPFSHIELTELSGSYALNNSLNLGSISCYYDENETATSGINASRQADFYTNTLVFLGFNSRSYVTYDATDEEGNPIKKNVETGVCPLFATPEGRQAVSELLSRTDLLERVYYNRGHVATGVLNTLYAFGGGTLAAAADEADAKAKIEALGYRMGMDGYYHKLDENGLAGEDEASRLTVRLAVYSGSSCKRYLAQLVAETLKKAGFNVVTQEIDSMEAFTQKITSLDFDMYIGEIKLYNNMDMSAFFTEGGAASYGISVPEELLAAYTALRGSTGAAEAFETAFAAQLPFAPLLWRSGTLYYSKALSGFSPSVSSVFYDLQNVVLS